MRKAETSPSFESLVKNPGGSLRNERKCPPNKSVLTVGGMPCSIGFIELILAEKRFFNAKTPKAQSFINIGNSKISICRFISLRLCAFGAFALNLVSLLEIFAQN